MRRERDAGAGNARSAQAPTAPPPGGASPEPAALPPAPRSAAQRLALVQRFVERLGDSRDLGEVLATVDASMRDALGAAIVDIAVTDRRRECLVTLLEDRRSGSAPFGDPVPLGEPMPLGSDLPAARVARTGESVFWSSAQQRERAGAGEDEQTARAEAAAVVPMVVDGSAIGVLTVGWEHRRRFSRADVALLSVLAQQCAVAVDRARLQESERAERDTLELLNEAIRILVGPLDPAEIVRGLVRLAVPTLSPWCAVYVAEHRRLRRVAIEIAGDPAFATELQGRLAVPTDSDAPLARCYRTGETLVVPIVTPEMVRGVYDEALAARMPRLDEGAWTALVVPVKAGGRVIGVMSLVSRDWAGDPPDQVRHAAEGLAGRAGIAISNADSFERARLTAALLTEALLPTELPTIPGYEVATRYLLATGDVAGDWFDVAHLPSGRLLIGMGDVAGQGIPAAALMAQLRNAARGLAVGGEAPAGILHGLALLVVEDDREGFATALYGILDPPGGALRWASAGHLPPLLRRGGDAQPLLSARRPPLGAPARDPAPEQILQLGAGDTFVVVSDGVTERRSADLGERLESLRSLVARHGDRSAASLADLLVDVLCDEPEDDCCVLVLKRL